MPIKAALKLFIYCVFICFSNLAVANFGEFQAKLVRMEKSWELQSNNNIKFTEMRLIARKLANLLVGIKRIEIY